MNADRTLPGDWYPGRIPENVELDPTAYVETTYSFLLCRSQRSNAVKVGRGSSFYLGVMFDLGPNARVRVGDYVLIHGARIICDTEITVGNYSLISWNVVLMDTFRLPHDARQRRRALERQAARPRQPAVTDAVSRPVHIGASVWIGFDCCILPGVTIGDGAVIGARSVVAADVPPFTVAAGNPARHIRSLEPTEIPLHV